VIRCQKKKNLNLGREYAAELVGMLRESGASVNAAESTMAWAGEKQRKMSL